MSDVASDDGGRGRDGVGSCCCCFSCLTAFPRNSDTLMMNMNNNVKHHKWLYGHISMTLLPNIESQHDFNIEFVIKKVCLSVWNAWKNEKASAHARIHIQIFD